MSEIVVQHQKSSISSKSWREQVIFPSDDDIDVRLALDQYTLLNVYGAIALQRLFVGRNIIPSDSEQLVYGISPGCCVLYKESANSNFIDLDLTLPCSYISYLRVYSWVLGLYDPEALMYSLSRG